MLSPVRHHQKHHRLRDSTLPRIKDCLKCRDARWKCEQKLVYKSRKDADKHALATNIERHWWPDACMRAYRCRLCRWWHLTTASSVTDTSRVEKMHRQWMRKTGQRWDLPDAG